MSKEIKNPNFLFYGAEQKTIVQKVDENRFLNLHLGNTARIDLFLFAVALGIETIPTEVKQKETFIREEYVRTKHDAFLYSLYLYKNSDKDDLELIKEKDRVYELVQNYANTGFNLISDLMKNKSEKIVELELIKELDQEYEKLFI